MRRADVRVLLENVGVRFEAAGWTFALGEEAEAMIDDIVGKDTAVGVLRGLRRIEAQHVGQKAVGVDRGDCFFAGVIAGMTHQMDELIEPALAIVNRLAGVVFLLGLVGVEEAADRRVAGAIDVEQLAVFAHAALSPNVYFGLRGWLARWQLYNRREHVGLGIRIHAGPWRFGAEVRLGEVPFAPDIEHILDSVKVEKESVAATAGEEGVGAGLDD